MSTLLLLPAIDLRGGRCVRLVQGDPGREQVFGDDPAAMARRWVEEGAQALHVVDLDGAFAGRPQQLHLLAAIAEAVDVPVQFGGGLRTEEDVDAALQAGAARVVVGTRALEEAFFRRLLDRWGPGRIVAGLDAKGDTVAVAGWVEESGVRVPEAASRLRAWGAELAVYTQVQRDGMLSGPDLDGIRRVMGQGLGVIASGGVTTAEDIRNLAGMGAAGAILGRTLYAGRLALSDALRAAASA